MATLYYTVPNIIVRYCCVHTLGPGRLPPAAAGRALGPRDGALDAVPGQHDPRGLRRAPVPGPGGVRGAGRRHASRQRAQGRRGVKEAAAR